MKESPDWVETNRKLKSELDLPKYEPPRFDDDVSTHVITKEIERNYGVTIIFAGKNTEYLDDWQVLVDETPVLTIGRHRDESGNTIYEISSHDFKEKVENRLISKDLEDC